MALKILIAEDYQDLADSYRAILEGRGHEVMITGNGMECTNIFRQYVHKQMDGSIKPHFDLVILDQKMPFMDGIETAKEIQFLNPQQKIIFITGNGENVLQKLPQLSGNIVVMNKPFTVQALLLAVEGFGTIKFREMAKTIRQ
ncbi:response regulator [Candidatus Nitrosotalea bavarica]|uniref:response regulator n=1 Tax=Candidatus Nitrosotalea bavarica TaxID=1903277 RepID=UPI000C707849|nr:response regulator [Candidatus Nitrosotalea bavarica]